MKWRVSESVKWRVSESVVQLLPNLLGKLCTDSLLCTARFTNVRYLLLSDRNRDGFILMKIAEEMGTEIEMEMEMGMKMVKEVHIESRNVRGGR